MDLKLYGRKALVTGASRGLGFATGLVLAKEGASVAINSRSMESLEQAAGKIEAEAGSRPVILPGDVLDYAQVKDVVEQAAERLGGLDILVTNSGGPPSGSFETFDDDAWQNAFELNFLSHVRLIRAALPHLRRSSAASVLTVTSYSVKQPIPHLILSNSIRSATIGLTKTLALELGGDGIRFNSILPAWTETERVNQLMSHRAKVNDSSIGEEIQKQSKDSPFGRMGSPEEFANAAVFLVSPAAAYITGVMLTVDGGMYKGMY
jgi:3-oxoacyl-[acyl-carrier protein] reductase